jgi:hypothetical protein
MNCTDTTSDIVHYCPLPYPSISPFQVPVKALGTPFNASHRLSGVDLLVELDAGLLACSLRVWASVFIALKYSSRRSAGEGSRARASLPSVTACRCERRRFYLGYCALPYTGGLCELQESRPAIRSGVLMCGQDYPLETAGLYLTL